MNPRFVEIILDKIQVNFYQWILSPRQPTSFNFQKTKVTDKLGLEGIPSRADIQSESKEKVCIGIDTIFRVGREK